MWNSSKDLTDAFDVAFENAYGNGEDGELENLAKLFGPVAIANYAQALVAGLDGASSASVDVAWIDKRPIAVLKRGGVGAELGDMMLVIHEHDPRGLRQSRACILEVKQSPAADIPAVPVTSGKSTRNQFQVLSNWPTIHGLKRTGSNRSFLLENIKTQRSDGDRGVLAQAWYVAVKPRSAVPPVNQPWMAAPAVEGTDFEHTLGELFSACARGTSLQHPKLPDPVFVGRSFMVGNTLESPCGWDALINAMILITDSYTMPRSYFGPNATRRYISGGRVVGPAAAVGGFDFTSPALWPSLTGIVIGILLCVIALLSLVIWLYSRSGQEDSPVEHSAIVRGKFPVLFFQVFHGDPIDIEIEPKS